MKACGSHLTLFAMHLMGRMKFHKSAWKPMRRFSGFDTNLERSHKTFSFYCVHDTHTTRQTTDRQNFGKKRFLSMIGDIPRLKKEWLVEVKELVAVKLHWPSKMRIYSWDRMLVHKEANVWTRFLHEKFKNKKSIQRALSELHTQEPKRCMKITCITGLWRW